MLKYYKNKFIVNIGAVFLFFIAITAFIIYPVLTEISKVNREITDERIKLERKLALGLNIKKIIKDLEEIEGPAKLLDTIFINQGNELDFVRNLESIATKHGVDLEFNSDFIGEDLDFGFSQVEVQIILNSKRYLKTVSMQYKKQSLMIVIKKREVKGIRS